MMRGVLWSLFLLAGLGVGRGAGAGLELPAEWLRAGPGAKEAGLIEEGAVRHGWPAMASALRAGALRAYERGNLAAAEAWAGAAGWAEIWATTEREEGERRRRVEEGEAAPGPPPATGAGTGSESLAERLPSPLRRELLADQRLTAEFLGLLDPLDDRAAALGILARLHARDAEAFGRLAGLVTALALVHDTPPPAMWPHWQVGEAALPRRLAAAEEVFELLAGRGGAGGALWNAERLGAAELRFAVDLALPAEERSWARERVRVPLSRLDETYSMIRYRMDRIEAGAYVWPGASYRLEDILREGGICVDQAYFASQAGKARGVPTLLFTGRGRDGRHAWFGYLGPRGEWHLDAGRHESQNYVAGVALDPQTWREISDHELAFLSEGFRRERNAREARIHARFAAWLAEAGRGEEAEKAARTALRLERRTLEAWEVLLAARSEPGAAREELAREAAGGLTAYPELQAKFLGLMFESMRARGEEEAANRAEREMVRRLAETRGDLGVRVLAGQLMRDFERRSFGEQVRDYRRILRLFGRETGAALWDEVARPFVVALAMKGRTEEAREALELARESLGGVYGSQIDEEMRDLAQRLSPTRGVR
jgi:hypothetical protein